eukprot:gene6263-10270_t
MSEEKVFHVGDSIIQFQSILEVPEITNSFIEFLKKEHNLENFLFVLSVKNLEQLIKKKDQKQLKKEFNNIVNTYLAPKSPNELGILTEEKQHFLEKIKNLNQDEWTLEESPTDILAPFYKAVLVEYKNDSYKRYTRTEECLKLLEKHQHNRDVLLPRLTALYNYKDEDFEKLNFEEKDFHFMDEFFNDNPNWKLISEHKKKQSKIFVSKMNYFPNLTFLTSDTLNVKYQIKLNQPFQEACIAVFQNHHNTAYNEFITLDFKFGDFLFAQGQSKLPYPLYQRRVARNLIKFIYDPEKKQLTLYTKCSNFPGCEFLKTQQVPLRQKDKTEKKLKAIPMFYIGTTKLTYIDKNTTMFDMCITYDIKRKTKYWALDIIVNGLHNSISKEYSKTPRRIADMKFEFNELWEGLPVQPFGKLIWDLDIDGLDEQYQQKMEKRKKVFQLSNYVVHFSSLKKKEIKDAYIKFLKSQHNTDSWDFISEYLVLKKLNEKSQFEKENKKVEEILKTYIEPKSSKDLCLSKDKIEDLKDCLSNRIKNYPTFKYFNKIYQDVKLEHQLDSFKRFVQIDEVQEILAKYQHDVIVMSPILGLLSSYNNDDFKNSILDSKDLNFAQAISDNSNSWDSIHTTDEMKISVSSVNWFSKLSFIKDSVNSYQFEIILPFELQQVANGYLNLNKMNTIDTNITKSKFISYSLKEGIQRECCCVEMEMLWEWDSPKKKINAYTFVYYPNELVFISKPVDLDGNLLNTTKESPIYFQYEIISLSGLKGGKTKFNQIIIISMPGKTDWKKIMIERGKTFLPSLKSSVENSKKKIIEMKEKYMELKDDKPKDILGMMLLNLDIDKLAEEDGDILESESINETSFIDDSEMTSENSMKRSDKLSSSKNLSSSESPRK